MRFAADPLPGRAVPLRRRGCCAPRGGLVKVRFRVIPFVLLALITFAPSPARAQAAKAEMKQPPTAIIRIYRIAAGKQLDFLKWLAEGRSEERRVGKECRSG